MPTSLRSSSSPWLAVLVVCLAQFMTILDTTIVNVALPSIQADLGFSTRDLQWVVNAYMLVFGGFLLLGGRAADLLGRRRVLVAGVAVFTVASLAVAVAPGPAALVAARALQGLGAALVAPAALSIITTSTPEGPMRAKALAVYAGISGSGAAAGLLLGGVLTDALSWPWVFLINVPVGVVAIAAALRYVPESRAPGLRRSFDLPGAILVTGGLMLVTLAIVQAQDYGFGDPRTAALALAAAALLGLFAVQERRASAPLVRLDLLRTRTLAAANFATLLLVGGTFAMFYLGTLYFQQIKGYDALQSGAAFLPQALGFVLGATLSQRLVARLGFRRVLVGGILVGTLGLLWITRLEPDSSYWTAFLPALVPLSLGIGLAFVPLTMAATANLAPTDQGLASGIFNSAQNIGGALGIAILSTVANATTGGSTAPDALVDGYTAAFAVAAGMLIAAGVAAALLLRGEEVGLPDGEEARATAVA